MATQYDVLQTLESLISSLLYPNGVDEASIAGVDVQVVQGWPNPKGLDDFVVKAGNVAVSIYPSQLESDTTRGLGDQWEELTNNGETGESLKEVKRQEKSFQVRVWANDPIKRNNIFRSLEAALCDTSRLTFVDGSGGNMKCARTFSQDNLENEGLFVVDIFLQIEYAVVKVETDYVVVANTINIKGG